MHLFLDNELVSRLKEGKLEVAGEVRFAWPSFLHYLGHSNIFDQVAPFEEGEALFQATVEALHEKKEPDVPFYMYDRLFAEVLGRIQVLPEIDPAYLLVKMAEDKTLEGVRTRFVEKPLDARHDLILYLAWDRMCVWMGNLFNHTSKDPLFIEGIQVLRECLLESYAHISSQGKTTPSLFRLAEALLYYEMREERIPLHSDSEWALLSESFPLLKSPNALIDFHYIDRHDQKARHLTTDSLEAIQKRIRLVEHLVRPVTLGSPDIRTL